MACGYHSTWLVGGGGHLLGFYSINTFIMYFCSIYFSFNVTPTFNLPNFASVSVLAEDAIKAALHDYKLKKDKEMT